MLHKSGANFKEVQLNPAELGQFMVLNANDNGDSVQSFAPAARVTHDIPVKCNADELVQAWLHA